MVGYQPERRIGHGGISVMVISVMGISVIV